MEKIDILPQSIFKFECDQKLLETTLETLKKEEYRREGVHTHKSKQTVSVRLDKEERYSEIYDWFHQCLEEVRLKFELECDKIKISSSWGNRTGGHSIHGAHSHPNSFISGIFYLTDSSAKTVFFCNNHWTGDNDPLKPTNLSNIVQMMFPGSEHNIIQHFQPSIAGNLILFPSSLIHAVTQTEHNAENRYTMSFNSFPCGKIGRDSHNASVNIEIL